MGVRRRDSKMPAGRGGRRAAAVCAAVALLLALLAGGCGTKRNTAMSRNWQAFTTRYNVYYNGDEHYKEQLAEMERSYQDDYTRTLLTHPAEARADQKLPQPTGDFKRTIEKMQKAIQLHSIKKKPARRNGSAKEKAFRAREEFNPFLHNAWMMMGRGQYYSGDFLGAASTFLYISKHFKWLPRTVTEAQLWQARCYCALDWLYEAEDILRRIKEKDLTDKKLRHLYDLAESSWLVRSERWADAVPYLQRAARSAGGSQRNRLWFLLGQAYTQLGRRAEAYEAFRKAGSGASTDYRTKFNARIKRSEVYQGKDIRGEVNALKSMARYQRNKEYLDQIYYAVGNLYMSRKDTAEALKYYTLAVEKSTRQAIDKALAQLSLGNIYFMRRDYVKAQPCYSEAVPQLPETYPGYKTLRKRSDVLDELAVYAGNVHLQDSLLELSAMSPERQLEACERLAKEYNDRKRKEEEEALRQQYESERDAAMSQGGMAAPAVTPGLNSGDKSWYFYNTMAKNAGKTEFQRKWGARKLEDDWRRRNKTSFSFDEGEEGRQSEAADSTAADAALTDKEREELARADDPGYAEYYLRQIPKTDEERQTCADVIQEGLYNMGVILKDKLEDYPAARSQFDELQRRYPDNIYRLDVYYNMYLMAVRDDDAERAAHWRDMILADFPDSPYGQAMKDPAYFDNLRRMHLVQQEMYDEAYAAYLADDNRTVHRLTAEMEKDYPLSKILPKFVFIDALSYLTDKDYDKFRERLEELLRRWPDTDMTDMAGAIVTGLKQGRKPQSGSANSRGLLWDTRLTDSEAPAGAGGQPAAFERDPSKPQYLVLAFPRDSVSANQLLYDVARFNFSSFVVKDFDLEPMSFGNVGLLIVKGFANMRELEHYRGVMASQGFELPAGVRPVMISKANFELLLREGRSFEEYFRFEEASEAEAAEAAVVGDDRTMPPGPGQESSADSESPESTESPEPDPESAPAESEEETPGEGGESSDP